MSMDRIQGRGIAALIFSVGAASAAAFALAAATASGPTSRAAEGTSVTIDTGRLEGVTQDEVISFKGIPFAKPPVGELRWKPPQPLARWSGVRKAESYGADCMQVPFPSDAAPLGMKPAEDCLGALRILRAPGALGGAGGRPARQLRDHGPDRCPEMDPPQHRGLRR